MKNENHPALFCCFALILLAATGMTLHFYWSVFKRENVSHQCWEESRVKSSVKADETMNSVKKQLGSARKSIENINNILKGYSERHGEGPEILQTKQRNAASETHKQIIMRSFADGDILGAIFYATQTEVQQQMTTEDRVSVEKMRWAAEAAADRSIANSYKDCVRKHGFICA